MALFFLLLISGAIYCADKEAEKKEKLNVPPLDLSVLKKTKNPKRGRRYTREELTRIREKHMQQQTMRPSSEPPKDK